MPLKAVRQVTARFVDPPELDHAIGDHVHKLRREADLWPLYFLHVLVEVGGLLVTAPPLLQVSFLLVWWHDVNWLITYPFAGMGAALPPSFNQIALTRLCVLPVGKIISFEDWADDLIQRTRPVWTARTALLPPCRYVARSSA